MSIRSTAEKSMMVILTALAMEAMAGKTQLISEDQRAFAATNGIASKYVRDSILIRIQNDLALSNAAEASAAVEREHNAREKADAAAKEKIRKWNLTHPRNGPYYGGYK